MTKHRRNSLRFCGSCQGARSGADLFSLVKQASARASHDGVAVTRELLMREVLRKRPRVEALYQEFAELRRWGAIFCEPASAG